jgi:2-dehydropantoate 2-reductase
VLACKEPTLAEALEAVTPLLGAQTRLLPLLNGVRHIDMLAARYPQTPLLAGARHEPPIFAPTA